jgi:hypothetical protein
VTGRRGSEGVTLVYASRSRRLATGAAGADRFFSLDHGALLIGGDRGDVVGGTEPDRVQQR